MGNTAMEHICLNMPGLQDWHAPNVQILQVDQAKKTERYIASLEQRYAL